MTLIIGIKCQESIVVAADGAATLATTAGLVTIKQPVKKLEIVGNQAILGVSGQVGTAQLYKEELTNLVNSKKLTTQPLGKAMSMVRDNFRNQVRSNLELAASLGVRETAYSSAVVAVPVSAEPRLIQFDHLCQPEEATVQLPFISIGSGQSLADPFLAFLKRVFWKKSLPSLAQGLFAAVWTLLHATEIAPAFVSRPLQIAILEKAGDLYKARELSDKELEEHIEACSAAEEYLSQYGSEGKEPEATPDIPQP